MTPLEHALAYAELGWRVAPIPPGHKFPKGYDEWQKNATTDPAKIRKHWGKHPDHGVCLACGPASRIVAIDIDSYKGGDDGWAELEALHGPAPETVEAITGGGGRHLLYRHPVDGPTITNAGAAHLPAGIDVRGDGGQICVAPTIHPSGQPYVWEVLHDPLDGFPVADMPDWLTELLTRPPVAQQARTAVIPYAGIDSVVDLFAANHTWPQLLEADGWTFHSSRAEHSTGEVYEMWTRPGKLPRDGASATLYYRGSDVLKVFTADPPAGLAPDQTYTRFGYYTATQHHGDHSAAGRAYRREANGNGITTTDGVVGIGGVAAKAGNTPPAAPSARTRPGIVWNGRQLDDVVADGTRALKAANDPPVLFVRAGQMARLRQDEDQRPIIEGLRTEHCRHALAKSADWWRAMKEGGLTGTSPPIEVATTILAVGEWDLPPLAGVVELPVLRPDGTFATDHGYDPSTRLYHWHRGDPYEPIPDQPTPEQLAEAVALVDEMLCDFPWDSTADRANAWALLLTPLVRAIVGQVPMALIDAPEPGTGKGLLIKLAATITIGRAAGLMAWPASDEELEKKVTAALMSGNTMLIFDNVEGMIKSPTLAAVLTADAWQGRVLGRSEMVMVPNRATWACTGNNIDVGGDLARRCYRIRLDAHQAQPWKRTGFKHPDLEAWAAENRGRLLHALCTIIRSWWAAGRPQAATISAMGGYTSWVRTVGGILDHAGIDDFLANLAEFHADADRESQAWEAFLAGWSDNVAEQPLTVAELIGKMADTYTGHRWREVLPDDLSGYWDTPGFSRRLGQALRKRVGRHFGPDGLHLVEMPRDRTKVAVYSVTSRSMSLFDAAGCEQHPADPNAVTSDDAKSAGSAGSSPALRYEKTDPQDTHTGFSPDETPNTTRETREPARPLPDPDEEF